MHGKTNIDWSTFSLAELKQDVEGGAPVLRGTRMPVQVIIDNLDYGVSIEEIAEQFEVRRELVKAVARFAQTQRLAHSVR